MNSRTTAWLLIVPLMLLASGCACWRKAPEPTAPPPVPAEVLTPAPPQGYFVTLIEMILSRSPARPTQ